MKVGKNRIYLELIEGKVNLKIEEGRIRICLEIVEGKVRRICLEIVEEMSNNMLV